MELPCLCGSEALCFFAEVFEEVVFDEEFSFLFTAALLEDGPFVACFAALPCVAVLFSLLSAGPCVLIREE